MIHLRQQMPTGCLLSYARFRKEGLQCWRQVTGFFSMLGDKFYQSVLFEDRWVLYVQGLGNTILIALAATVIGIAIGMIIAIIKVAYIQTGKFKIFSGICDIYLAVIRGTPVLVQLMILTYIVFAAAPMGWGVLIAMLSFGINSGAYVAEIIRAGILSIDRGQTEAGRSLGLSQSQTMRKIVLPQAIKNILPALFNEFITLLKETSVAGYVAVRDLTKAADIVRSRTYDAFFPLIFIAIIYLTIVLGLTKVQRMIERRLAQSDHR